MLFRVHAHKATPTDICQPCKTQGASPNLHKFQTASSSLDAQPHP